MRARLLIPDGWDFQKKGDGLTYVITPPEGRSAFTLHVERHHAPCQVKVEARTCVDKARQLAAEATQIEELSIGVLQGFGSVLTLPIVGSGTAGDRAAVTAIGNTRTGTFYTMRFDIPAGEWDEVWEKGRYLAGRFVLEDEE